MVEGDEWAIHLAVNFFDGNGDVVLSLSIKPNFKLEDLPKRELASLYDRLYRHRSRKGKAM
jgi:hypothetical protein